MTIAEQIKKERTLLNISQAQLAIKTGLSKDLIHRIEKGKHINPTIYVIRKIQESLNITITL